MIPGKQAWSLVLGGLLVLGLTGIVFAQTGAAQPAMITVGQVEPGNAVVVSEVTAPVSSWVVIHRDAQGALGPVIGRTPAPAGATPNVVVTLDEEVMAGDQLWVALYADGGQLGTLELDDGTDAQMVLANGYAAQPVTVGQASQSQAQQAPDAQAEQAEQIGVAAAIQAAQQEQAQEPVSQATAEQPPAQQDAAEAHAQALQAQIEQAQVLPTPTPPAEQEARQPAQGQTQAQSEEQPQQAPPATMPATGAAGSANPLYWLAGGLAVVGLYCGEALMRRLRGRSPL